MLNKNIKTIRKSKGLSQQELAVKLNIVRQTVSKWEQGLLVPDSDIIAKIRKAYQTFGASCVLVVCHDKRNEFVQLFDMKTVEFKTTDGRTRNYNISLPV